jgi:hypothetical protein
MVYLLFILLPRKVLPSEVLYSEVLPSNPLILTYPLSSSLHSLTPFPVSPRGERLLPLDVTSQNVISNIAIRISSQY